jgi:hypothetical protein
MERELTKEHEREGDPGPVAPEKIHMLKELCIVMGTRKPPMMIHIQTWPFLGTTDAESHSSSFSSVGSPSASGPPFCPASQCPPVSFSSSMSSILPAPVP